MTGEEGRAGQNPENKGEIRGQNLHWEPITIQSIGRTWASFQVRWKGSDQRRDAIHLMFEHSHAGCHVESGWKGSMCVNKQLGQEALAVTHRRGCDIWVQRGDSEGGEKQSSSGYILTFIDKLDVCEVYEK